MPFNNFNFPFGFFSKKDNDTATGNANNNKSHDNNKDEFLYDGNGFEETAAPSAADNDGKQQANGSSSNRPPYVINTLTDSHDAMRALKPGDIVYDERRGKWYRVTKQIFPTHLHSGPLGLGDPDDKFLRKIEKNVLLPDLMAKRIESIECRPEFREFVKCQRKEGIYENRTTSCKAVLQKFRDCKLIKFRDPEFRQRITDEFLQNRADFRRTGKQKEIREFERFLKWKEEKLVRKLKRQGKEIPVLPGDEDVPTTSTEKTN